MRTEWLRTVLFLAIVSIGLTFSACSCGEDEAPAPEPVVTSGTVFTEPVAAADSEGITAAVEIDAPDRPADEFVTAAAEPAAGPDERALPAAPPAAPAAAATTVADLIAQADSYQANGEVAAAFAIYSDLVDRFAHDYAHLEAVYYLNERIALLDVHRDVIPGWEPPPSITEPVTLADQIRSNAVTVPADNDFLAQYRVIAEKFPDTLWGKYSVFMLETDMVKSFEEPEAVLERCKAFITDHPDNPYVKWAYSYVVYQLAQQYSNDYANTGVHDECAKYVAMVKDRYRDDELVMQAMALCDRILANDATAWDDLTRLTEENSLFYEDTYWRSIE